MSGLRDILRLQDQLRQCLLAGRIDGLAPLVAQLEDAATAALDGARIEPAGLAELRRQARANEVLIGAAMKGVRAAAERLRALREAGKGLSVYTAEGRTVRHGPPAQGVERRA